MLIQAIDKRNTGSIYRQVALLNQFIQHRSGRILRLIKDTCGLFCCNLCADTHSVHPLQEPLLRLRKGISGQRRIDQAAFKCIQHIGHKRRQIQPTILNAIQNNLRIRQTAPVSEKIVVKSKILDACFWVDIEPYEIRSFIIDSEGVAVESNIIENIDI